MKHPVRKISFAFLALLFGYVIVDVARALDWQVASLRSEFHEDLREEVPLSGSLLAGVGLPVRGRSFAKPQLPPLMLFVPASITTLDACVTVRSRDGRYRAANTYQLPAAAKGRFAQLNFPTKHSGLLSKFREEDVTLIAFSGSCEDGETETILPGTWGEPAQPLFNSILIYVNAGRKRVTGEIISSGFGPKECRRLEKVHTKVFDTICTLTLPDSYGDEIAVKLIEYRLGNEEISSSIFRIKI